VSVGHDGYAKRELVPVPAYGVRLRIEPSTWRAPDAAE